MDSRQQLTLIDKILRELEDLKKSQATVLKKISQIEAENINLGSELLNEALPGIHEGMDDAVQKLTALLDQFKEYRTEFERDHPASQAEGG